MFQSVCLLLAVCLGTVSSKTLEERVLALEEKAIKNECALDCIATNDECMEECRNVDSNDLKRQTECFFGQRFQCINKMMTCISGCNVHGKEGNENSLGPAKKKVSTLLELLLKNLDQHE